ncbi:MAG: acyltransferase family protein [Eubacteriales bacterium]|nr:acyltransferase family protein [Eubacteriales bacterium]
MSQQKEQARIYFLDTAKGLAMILVMLGHYTNIPREVNLWLSGFHLPVFFLVTGMLYSLKNEQTESTKILIRKKIRGILVPYLWFSLITMVWHGIHVAAGRQPVSLLWNALLDTVVLRGMGALWFLPVTLFAQILLILVVKRWGMAKSGVLFTVLALIGYRCYTFGTGGWILEESKIGVLYVGEFLIKGLIAACFMCYGGMLEDFLEKRFDFFSVSTDVRVTGKSRSWILPAAGVLLFGVTFLEIPLGQIRDLNHLNIGSLPVYLCLGTCGALGLLILCRYLPECKALTKIGKHSLIIMATHVNLPVMAWPMKLGEKLVGILAITKGAEIFTFAVTMILALAVEYMLIYLIPRYMPFLIGKKYR